MVVQLDEYAKPHGISYLRKANFMIYLFNFCLVRATGVAYGRSQAGHLNQSGSCRLHHSRSNAGSPH